MNNKVGIYYAYWTHEWDVDFNPYVDKAADLDFDILEVNGGTIGQMSKGERKILADHAKVRGMELSYCIGIPKEFDVASEDAETRHRGVDYLMRLINGIGEMGGGDLSGILYGTWPATMPEGNLTRQDYLELSLNSVRQVSKAAEDNNVVMCMEIVNRFEQFLLNTAAEGVEYCKAMNSSNVKILLDTFHMNIEEDSIASAVESTGEYLGHIHLGENHRMPPGCGRGHIPWAELVSALKNIDFKGSLVMEPFLVPGGQVGKDIKIWRDQSIGYDLDTEARKACAFMKKKLSSAG